MCCQNQVSRSHDKGASTLTPKEFASAVESVIEEAKAKGLPSQTLLIEIEDIASLLREELDSGSPPSLRRKPPR
jgi:hypothetical protein